MMTCSSSPLQRDRRPVHPGSSLPRCTVSARRNQSQRLRGRACGRRPAAGVRGECGPDQIDWDATLRLRHDLWALGLGVAESMDTAQRGMGLDWAAARELAGGRWRSAVGGGRSWWGSPPTNSPPPPATRCSDAYLEQVARSSPPAVRSC